VSYLGLHIVIVINRLAVCSSLESLASGYAWRRIFTSSGLA